MKTLPILALTLCAAPGLADTLVLEVPGIAGDSTVAGFADAIDVSQYSFGASAFGGSSSSYFSMTGDRDRSFPPMVLACLDGQVLGTVTMSVIAGDGSVRAELIMTSAVCTSVSLGLMDSEIGTQSYNFDFAGADWQYFGTSGKGKDTIGTPGSSTAPPGFTLADMTNLSAGFGGPSGLFLKLGDIPGDSTVNGFSGYIEPSAAGWGVANQGGFRSFQNLGTSGPFDSSFGSAYQQLLDDKFLTPVELELMTLGETAFKIVLTGPKLRGTDSYGSDAGGSDIAYSLDYETIEIHHTLFDSSGQPQGTVIVGWDLTTDMEL